MNLPILLDHPWFGTWTAALVAVVIVLLAHRIGSLLLLRITRSAQVLHPTVVKARVPSKVVLLLLALQTVWQAAPDELRWIDNVRHVNGLLLIAAMTWLVARVIAGFAQGVLDRHPVDVEDNMNARRIHTQTRVLSRIAMALVVVIGAAMLLMTFPGARQVGASLLASAQIFVLASDHEGLPVSILEAMRAGLPVIASDLPGIREEFGKAQVGLLVPGNDEAAMADALSTLARAPAKRTTMGQSARARWSEAFGVDTMAEATWQVYQRALGPGQTAAMPAGGA